MRRYYYDMRFLVVPALALLQSYYAGMSSSSSSSFVMKQVEMVFFSALLAAFLLATIRIQLFAAAEANAGRRLELRCGRSALSVPLTLSLIIALFVPLSSLVNAYLVIILVMSLWSDPIHHFITRFSYAEERQLMLLPVTLAQHPTLPPPLLLTPN